MNKLTKSNSVNEPLLVSGLRMSDHLVKLCYLDNKAQSGLGHFTTDFGTNFLPLKVIEFGLKIKWYNAYRKKDITAFEIKSIQINKDFAVTDKKDSKAIKLPVKNYEDAQRTSVLNLFRQFAEARWIGIRYD